MKRFLLMMMVLAMAIPIWASDYTVTINRGEGLYQDGTGVYYCVKDGIMMTFTDGLDNENYLVERRAKIFEVRSANYIIKKVVFHCVDNTTQDNLDCFYWGPTTISQVNNFTYPGQLGNYYVTNNGYDGVWEGSTAAFQFTTADGKPVRFGSVDIIYDKLDGDIFDLVTQRSQITADGTYIIASQYHDKVMSFKKTDDATFPSADIVEWVNADKTKVKVDGNACMIKMLGAKDSTYSNYTRRVATLSTLINGYIRVGTGNDEGNLLVTTTANDYSRGLMYCGNDYNYLCWFKGDNYSNSTHTIRYDTSDHAFKVMSTEDTDTRVWLYKLSQSYHVYTQCDPNNGGTITLGDGVVDGTSQENETVYFHVGTNWGYRIKQVSVINNATQEVTVLTPETIAGDGNDYSFTMPAADVTVKAEYYQTLFLLGTVNGRTTWAAGGPEFNYDVEEDKYYLDVYFKGFSSADPDPNGYFNLATATSNVDWTNRDVSGGDWNAVQGRLFAESPNKEVGDGSTATLYGDGYHNDYSFKIPAGVYRITVNKEMNQMSIARTYPTMTFDPVSGSTVQVGTDVHITSDLQSLVHAIAQYYGMHDNNNGPCEQDAIFYSTTDNWASQVEQQQEGVVTLSQVGTTTVKSSAAIGQIIVNGQATYTITEAVTLYEIKTYTSPEGAGTYLSITPEYAAEGDVITFGVKANDGYVYQSKEVYSDDVTIGDIVCTSLGIDENGYRRFQFTMPAADVNIIAYFERDVETYEVICRARPVGAGIVRVNGIENTFEYEDEVSILVYPYYGNTFNGHITAINDDTDEPVHLDSIGLYYGNVVYIEYRFTMPEGNVIVTAYFDVYTPLQVIEHPNSPQSGTVTVSDELIGTWAAKNYLWAKDQSPQVSNDEVVQPGGTTDYVRQNIKLQKNDWDQSNWVILDFSTIPGWDQVNDPYNEVANYVDHKILAGSITGQYDSERGLVDASLSDNNFDKVQHIIHLSALPEIVGSKNQPSLGYPGYMSDPLEEAGKVYQDPSDYMYNHYVPANFWQAYIGGKYGTVPVEGVTPPNDPEVRLFFMNPKDREVAQVWGVYVGQKTFLDPYQNKNVTGDVFEVYETYPTQNPTINAFGLAGAFWVPSTDGWDYNRKGTGQTANDYGKPSGENALKLNTAYLFHAAITTQIDGLIPVKAPMRSDQDNAPVADYTPWTHYMVYPLDMPNDGSNWTAVQEIMSQESFEIESIRYYNVMGQESTMPFDGINIRVIRYKDGSFNSMKILK